MFLLAEDPPQVRLDYHCEPGRITYHSLTVEENENKLEVPWLQTAKDCPKPTAQQLIKLQQLKRSCHEAFKEALKTTHEALRTRRTDENNICAWRYQADRGERDREVQVLVDSVYDLARKRAREAAQREGIEEEKAEEASHKVDILAPYLVEFQGGGVPGVWKPLDPLQAEFVAKKCKNDFRRRLLDRAAIIQKRLEEEQDQLKKRRSQMQRRGDNVEKERAFETYQSDAMFRIQILEQRLARHETLAIKKFADLEKTLTEDKRLEAMWIKPGR